MHCVELWHFKWPWVTFEGHFGDLLATLCVQLTCSLLATAKFLVHFFCSSCLPLKSRDGGLHSRERFLVSILLRDCPSDKNTVQFTELLHWSSSSLEHFWSNLLKVRQSCTFRAVLKPVSSNRSTDTPLRTSVEERIDLRLHIIIIDFIQHKHKRLQSCLACITAVFEEEEDVSNRSFFSEIVSSISDVRFSRSGVYMMTRDYMTVKVWDVRLESRPVETYSVHDYLRGKLCTLYENDCIFDKFECIWSNSDRYTATTSNVDLLTILEPWFLCLVYRHCTFNCHPLYIYNSGFTVED